MIEKIKGYFENDIIRLASGALFFALALIFELHSLFVPSVIFYLIALAIAGAPVFVSAVKGIFRRDFLDEKFLMSIASIGAMIIGDMSEGVAVMLFFLLGEIFEKKAVRKSRNSIKSLMNIRPDEATVIIDGREEIVDAEDVEVGSEIVIRAGERVPIDCTAISGSADVDTSMLTGESIPRSVQKGDSIESGTIVLNGVLWARTQKSAEESSAQRILELVENASESKAREEKFITVFSRVYTPIVVGLALLIGAFLPIVSEKITYTESVYRALTFLVVSCPCALVISVPMAFFGGIGGAAANGILFKGGNVFSAMSKTDTFVFDKTGTLTTGKIRVERVVPQNISEAELRLYASSAEHGSLHPISAAIKALCEKPLVPEKNTVIAGKGVYAIVGEKEVLVGNRALLYDCGVVIPADTQEGVFVSINGVFSGVIVLEDDIKPEAKKALIDLKCLGAKRLCMLSGDRTEKVKSVASKLGIDEAVGELLPEDKYRKLGKIINSSTKTAFVGDGINDAPSLVAADVGIAMGGIGSDSAIEAADIVIMNDNISKIAVAKRIAKRTLAIAKQNIIFAIGVKVLVLLLGALGYADMWLAVFADVGVAVIAILNSMRALRVKK